MKSLPVLDILRVFAWIIFIGLCIETGAMLTSFIYTLWINPLGAIRFYKEMNFAELLAFDRFHYAGLLSMIIFISGLKAYLFYWVVKITTALRLSHPFSEWMARSIARMSSISLQIGIMAVLTDGYADWLTKNSLEFSYEGGDSGFLFLAGILFLISTIFLRGLELQAENELTV